MSCLVQQKRVLSAMLMRNGTHSLALIACPAGALLRQAGDHGFLFLALTLKLVSVMTFDWRDLGCNHRSATDGDTRARPECA